jgi:hypothetical protein
LRLLELHETDLDRARAAIERRLSIDELLAEPTPPASLPCGEKGPHMVAPRKRQAPRAEPTGRDGFTSRAAGAL